jgi:hypothetical protein
MLAAALIVAAIIYGECGDSDIDGGGLSTDQGGRKRGPSLRRRIIKLVQCSASYLWLSSPGLYPWGWPKVIA